MAASVAPPGVVDTTKPKSYPVILSDTLLGRSPKEMLTGIRCNHKPTLSSDTAPNDAELLPSFSNAGSFSLSFYENGGKFAYNGTRSAKDNQYVLIFDPERRAFVLHRIDSIFNMNLTKTPYNNDAQDLEKKHPHVDSNLKGSAEKKGAKATASKKETKSAKSLAADKTGVPASRAVPDEPKSLQTQEQQKKKHIRSPIESEEEDDDDDGGGLLIEYPDSPPNPTARPDFSPAFPTTIRRFSEFVRDEESESDEDADAEYDEDDLLGEDDDISGEGDDGFKLPSPMRGTSTGEIIHNTNNGNEPGPDNADDLHDDFEDDLEKELEKELEQEFSGMDVDAESSVSEED